MKKPSLASYWQAIAIASVALFALGCGELNSTVSGVVKLDDEVLKCDHNRRGTIVFSPVAGGASATGIIDDNGRYSVRTGSSAGVKPGDYHVGVRVLEIVPHEDGVSAPSGEPITPALYSNPLTSGLIVTLASGNNTFDIKLDSSAGPLLVTPPVIAEAPSEDADGDSQEDSDSSVETFEESSSEAAESGPSEEEASSQAGAEIEAANNETTETIEPTVDTERVEE